MKSTLLVCCALIYVAAAESPVFSYSSCGGCRYNLNPCNTCCNPTAYTLKFLFSTDDQSSATITKFVVTPDPISIPGKVSWELDAELNKHVTSASMSLKLVRKSFLLDITLPCYDHIGSWLVCRHYLSPLQLSSLLLQLSTSPRLTYLQ